MCAREGERERGREAAGGTGSTARRDETGRRERVREGTHKHSPVDGVEVTRLLDHRLPPPLEAALGPPRLVPKQVLVWCGVVGVSG